VWLKDIGDGRSGGRMSVLIRSVVALLVFLTVFFFSVLFMSIGIAADDAIWLPHAVALVLASLSAFWIWRTMRDSSGGILTTAIQWAAIVGVVGFCLGFFGPMILAPQSNQGPLLGILITGPFGFIAGGLCGLVYALLRRLAAR
jgi:hypothetical protein